ncbi:MAG TPA: hypothetical protein VFF96_04410 [Pseudoxanthomonas sp.]|nr:hypothetical protein [Pseudoxanthomonas sp.]
MPKMHARFAILLLPLALAACNKPAEGATQAEATVAPAAEPAAAPVAEGKAFEENTTALVKGAAKMQASTVACQLATQAQVDDAVAKQRARYVSEGYDGDAFDRLHDAAYKETLDKFNGVSAGQKAQGCEQIKAFGDKMRQMGEEMQRQMDANH